MVVEELPPAVTERRGSRTELNPPARHRAEPRGAPEAPRHPRDWWCWERSRGCRRPLRERGARRWHQHPRAAGSELTDMQSSPRRKGRSWEAEREELLLRSPCVPEERQRWNRVAVLGAAFAWCWAAVDRLGPGVWVAMQGALRGAHSDNGCVDGSLRWVLSLGGHGQPAWVGARCLEGNLWTMGAACPGALRAARQGHTARASVRSSSGLIHMDFVGCSSFATFPYLCCGVLLLGVPSVGHMLLAKAVMPGARWMWEHPCLAGPL